MAIGGQDGMVLRELSAAVQNGEPVVLATIVATRRSVPRHAGTKMLIYPDWLLTGTEGGGELESREIEEARAAYGAGRPQLLD